MPVVLHLAPHPDDEILGAGGTLLSLVATGSRVVNLACSLGRPEQAGRREAELTEACRIAGFELRLTSKPIGISASDDLVRAQADLAREIASAIDALAPDLVVGPSPHDGHHGHEVVGRATAQALSAIEARPVWWMWTLWGEAPLPSLLVPISPEVMDQARAALAAHAGELERNDYDALLVARARSSAVLGTERVHGWGTAGPSFGAAEVLTEVLPGAPGRWPLGAARTLDGADPLGDLEARDVDLGTWLRSASPRTALLAGAGSARP